MQKKKEQLSKIRPQLTSTDRILEMGALATIAIAWMVAVIAYTSMPETIPIHFNIKGEPDGYGSRLTLMILPAIATLTIPPMVLLSRYPHIFNYVVKITPENQLVQYRLAARFIRLMAAGVGIIFIIILQAMITSAESNRYPNAFILITSIAAISIIPLMVYIIISSRSK